MRLSNTKHKSSYLRFNKFIITSCLFLGLGLYLGWKKIPESINAHYHLLSSSEFFPSLIQSNDLGTISLNINFENFQKIQNKRNEAVKNGLLDSNSSDFVGAKIIYKDKSLPCKVRLKGDFSDHWDSSKWSFRIYLKGDNQVMGMRKFSIQNPVTRFNTNEWLFHKTLKKEGLIGLRYEFMNIILNGKKMGIYAVEELFSKELIESNNRRQGVILGFDDELIFKKYAHGVRNINEKTIFETLPLKIRDESKTLENQHLKLQSESAEYLIKSIQNRKLSGDQVFSAEKLGKFLAVCKFWRAEHNFQVNNINFFYDAVTSKLEPIGFDGCCNSSEATPYSYFSNDVPSHSFWVSHVLKSPEVAFHYINSLSKLSKKSYINSLKKEFYKSEIVFRRLLTKDLILRSSSTIFKNFTSLLFCDPWKILNDRGTLIRKELDEKNIISSDIEMLDARNSYKITLNNRLNQPVEIIGFRSFQKKFSTSDLMPEFNKNLILFGSNDSIILPLDKSFDENLSTIVNFEIPISELNNSKLFVFTRILGLESPPLEIEINTPDNIKKNDLPFLKHNKDNFLSLPFVAKISKNEYSIPTGTYSIESDFFIPSKYSLFISPGVTLLFSDSTALICRGTIHALGNNSSPITFSSISSSWGGILINESSKKNVFKHCIFKNIGGIGTASNPFGTIKSGWNMTGGVNLYRADSTFTYCQFIDLNTEDGLNIIDSKFELNDSNFSNLISDGFDGDFVDGIIQNCKFENIKGDGVDFSGSKSLIKDCNFQNILDKAISIGENSKVTVNKCFIENVSFGVVAKDSSHARVTEIKIHNAQIAAFSVFQKKQTFGPAEMYVNNFDVHDSKKIHFVQNNNKLRINGEIAPYSIVDVDKLYNR